MNADVLRRLPAREGHFRLESGYHTNLWLAFDALFVSPRDVAPLVTALARRLEAHNVSAGSSVRATAKALDASGATTAVVGTFLLLGTTALDHFAAQAVPVEAIARRELTLWKPSECPLCAAGTPLADPS